MSNKIELKIQLEKLITKYIKESASDLPDYVVDGFIISCLENTVASVRTKELGTKEIRESVRDAKTT